MRHLCKLWIILAFSLICACSFSKPEKTIVLNLAAQNCGFLLAQENPTLAQEILRVSQGILDKAPGDFPESSFQIWATSVIEKLEIDPFLKMNFKEMLKLVQVEIELAEDQQEIAQLARIVIQNFIKGIEALK